MCRDGSGAYGEAVRQALPSAVQVSDRRLACLDELQDAARAINARLLDTERAGQGCVLANPVFERIARPTVDAAGRRATAMRFGDSRVQALAGALCVTVGAVTGITNRSLRTLMTGLLGAPYTMAQASYDLARLRRNGLISRRPHANTYDLTPGRPEVRDLLHQGPRSRPGPAIRRRATPGAAPAPRRPPQHRTTHRQQAHRNQAACSSLTNSAQLPKSSTQRVTRSRLGHDHHQDPRRPAAAQLGDPRPRSAGHRRLRSRARRSGLRGVRHPGAEPKVPGGSTRLAAVTAVPGRGT